MERLSTLLKKINGLGYKAYKEITGSYQFVGYKLTIDHVQGDAFAQPSRISIYVPSSTAPLPAEFWSDKTSKTAAEDFLARAVSKSIKKIVKGHRGIGVSGEVHIETSGQQILVRNAVLINSAGIEARLTIGLPAAGRTILANDAMEIFFQELPKVVSQGLFYANLDKDKFRCHIKSAEDQECLRGLLQKNNLAAFVADNSMLPRQSGVDDRPLQGHVIPFTSPTSLSCALTLPNKGEVKGMGIPIGVTLIVGGGFHGKSTLLHALERGIYNHIPGDGRELVVSDPSAVKVRAEDNRAISNIDLSPFINRLPFGKNTRCFSTTNASGSTSQAANIIEALENDASLLLIDEDTSATNFMIRDERMQKLVANDREPITPFLHRVQEIYHNLGVSSIIVMGGSGDYFEVSDTVIMMNAYQPEDATLKAHALVDQSKIKTRLCDLPPMLQKSVRRLDLTKLSPARGNKQLSINARGVDTLLYGVHEIDLNKVEQLIDIGQMRAIGLIIHFYTQHYADKTKNLTEGLILALKEIEEKGLDILSPWKIGTLALPRLHEVAATINRIRQS